MNLEMIFSLASIIAIIGWLLLLASPLIPQMSDKIAGLIIPVGLSAGYLYLLVFNQADGGGGYDSLASVMTLFSQEQAVLAGWVHFLAFDLFIGAWVCRTARNEGIKFLLVIPCLFLTFLFGPIGFLIFQALRYSANVLSQRRRQPN